eukprot:CAMPEP_0117429640 /NCGR_PEP_ID=MMETSP0758-20121206/9167_1 /TAXON_ID=63605 /ORGANISM="Percolomonas cosmopolitus, Strain AE-1 (ATCC 50343)" /LENGTH=226 /DNA_ID=CAMNT_0005216837 /DNA_START=69 /DNA_END=745 /DNA_ORIENTATION=+
MTSVDYLKRERENLKNQKKEFNLLLGDLKEGELYYYTTKEPDTYMKLIQGHYIISEYSGDIENTNNSEVPKHEKIQTYMRYIEQQKRLSIQHQLTIMRSTEKYHPANLPEQGYDLKNTVELSSIFINTPHYKTRVTNVIVIDIQKDDKANELIDPTSSLGTLKRLENQTVCEWTRIHHDPKHLVERFVMEIEPPTPMLIDDDLKTYMAALSPMEKLAYMRQYFDET